MHGRSRSLWVQHSQDSNLINVSKEEELEGLLINGISCTKLYNTSTSQKNVYPGFSSGVPNTMDKTITAQCTYCDYQGSRLIKLTGVPYL